MDAAIVARSHQPLCPPSLSRETQGGASASLPLASMTDARPGTPASASAAASRPAFLGATAPSPRLGCPTGGIASSSSNWTVSHSLAINNLANRSWEKKGGETFNADVVEVRASSHCRG